MRENRTYGSEGGETGKPVFPTPIIGRYRRRGILPRFLTADLGGARPDVANPPLSQRF